MHDVLAAAWNSPCAAAANSGELKRPRRVRAGRRPTVYGGPCTLWLAQRAGGRGLHTVDGRGTGALSPGGWAAVGERVSLQIVV